MKYRNEAAGLDLHEREAFKLYREDLGDTFSFPRGWLKTATPEDLTALGFEAYEPEVVIEEPPEPTVDDLFPPLKKYQFDAMVDFLGLDDAINGVINAMPDGIEKSLTKALRRNGVDGYFRRSSPLFEQIAEHEDVPIDSDDIDEYWPIARGL